MRSLVGVGFLFVGLAAACSSGLSPYKAPDGSAGGTGGLMVSDKDGGATSLPGGTTSSIAGATSVGGATSFFGGTTDSIGGASNTGGILPMGGTSSTSGTSSTGGTSSTSGTSSTGGIAPKGGTSSAGGTSGGGTGGSSIPLTGNCAALTCLNPMNDLLAACRTGATDTCTQQRTMTNTIVMNYCYTNGVKEQMSIGTDPSSATMTVKSGSSVCYSMAISGLSGNVVTVVVKNDSGTTVATIAQDSTTKVEAVTCPGGTPTVIDATCGNGNASNVAISMPDTSNCTDGTCAWADSGAAGTGGAAGTAGTGGAGGGNTGSSEPLMPGFTVDDGGYVTAGPWHGWAWPTAEVPSLGTTMTPLPATLGGTGFAATKAGSPLCASGTVAMDPNLGGVALVGIWIQQNKTPANAPLNTWAPSGTGVKWQISNTGGSPLRIQIQGAAGYPSAAWCSVLTGSSGTIRWSDFNTQCWPGGASTNYDGSVPLNLIMVEVPGSNSAPVPFNFCVQGLAPY